MFIPFAFQGTQVSSGDVDATAYIDEVKAQGGTLSGAEETAITTFYTNLKSAGIYSKLHVFYPFLGGVAASNAVEGINPGGTYDLTFNGTWTHSISGSSSPQTANTYADTNFNPSASADLLNSFSFGVYTLGTPGGTSNGYHGLGNGTGNYVLLGAVDNRTSYQFYNGTNNERVANTTGDWNTGVHFFQSRVANNDVFGGYADSIVGAGIVTGSSFTSAYPTPTNLTLWFNSNNGNDIELGGEMRFGWSGEGMDYSELQILSNEINNLQIAFNRNVYSSWTPADEDTLKLWYKSDEGITLSGTEVTAWESSDAGKSLPQYTLSKTNYSGYAASASMTYLASDPDANDYPSLRNDGTLDSLLNSAVSGSGGAFCTIVHIIIPDSGITGSSVLGGQMYNFNNRALYSYFEPTGSAVIRPSGSSQIFTSLTGSIVPTGNQVDWIAITANPNDTNGTAKIYYNSSTEDASISNLNTANGTITTSIPWEYELGGESRASGDNQMRGRILESMFFTTAPGIVFFDGLLDNINDYVQNKYN